MENLENYRQLAAAARYDARKFAKLQQVSVRQLQRDFKRIFGRTPQDWLNEQRIIVARNRLLEGAPVKQVAFEMGFKQSSHFSRHFKKYGLVTPSEYVGNNPLSRIVAIG